MHGLYLVQKNEDSWHDVGMEPIPILISLSYFKTTKLSNFLSGSKYHFLLISFFFFNFNLKKSTKTAFYLPQDVVSFSQEQNTCAHL
jgi:hypothetical protein